ncbi:MAG TPA: peptide ABC transporter substrate-binding protein [Candidatus Limnocylindria bacterium]|jgi:ABC-type transport system substrate-binding protein
MRRLSAAAGLLLAVLTLILALSPAASPASAGGQPLRYLAGDVGTLDPAFISSAQDVQLLLQLYAGLTRIDEDGAVYASLAEDWEVSDEGRTYTFTLRDDLAFSDGSPLTAADVRRSWLRILDPATGALAPDVLNVIAGAVAWRSGSGSQSEVGLEAPDDDTLVVHLEHAASHFPALAATPTAAVVPPQADASPSWQTVDGFVGSGPYVADHLDGANLVLEANPEYVAGPPPIDQVVWVSEVETSAPEAFANDEIDLVNVFSGDASWIRYDQSLGPFLHEAASLSVQYFGFDTTRPPFDDARVRRAFWLALDRSRLVELASGPAATAATSLVPPALWPDGVPADDPSDPEAARDLLREAGYADGADLGTITVNGTGLGVGPAVETWREELGVDIAIETMDFGDYIGLLPVRPPQVFTINWITDYPSPYALYGLLLLPEAASNYGHWADPTFVELMQAAAEASDPADQREAYLAVEDRVDEEAPVIPWSWDASHWLVRDGLNGVGQLTVGLLDFGRLSWSD